MSWKECNKMDEKLKFVAKLLDLVYQEKPVIKYGTAIEIAV